MQARRYAPPPDLGLAVETFWVGEWDLRAEAPHTTELLGDPSVHLVLEQSDAVVESRIVGVWTRLWRRELAGRGRVLGIKLRPGSGRAFLPVAISRLTNRVTPLERFFSDARALEREVLSTEHEAEAFARFSGWLRAHRRAEAEHDVRLATALLARVTSDTAITSVDHFAQVAGMHVRVLERFFFEHVGATPKSVIRRRRLQDVALRIERGEAPSLAALAAELGYTDQAHLSRDFKAATGKTPREFGVDVHR